MNLRKLHLGCGSHRIPDWENHDLDVDLRRPLPFSDASASFIFAEHVVEHITPKQAWSFFEECRRVLAVGGVVRIAIPDFVRLSKGMCDEYVAAVKAGGHGDGTKRSALRAVVFDHGHEAVWSQDLLFHVLQAVGFVAEKCLCGFSAHSELYDIEQHWKTVGRSVAENETGVVEGTKTC